MQQDLAEKEGLKAHLIGVGGSDAVGLWGYIDAWAELEKQGVSKDFDDVVVAVGSGGTAAGLAIGAHLARSPVKVHAVAVCDDAAYFHSHTDAMLRELGLYRPGPRPGTGSVSRSAFESGSGSRSADGHSSHPMATSSREILDVVDGYKGRGYGRAGAGDYAFIQAVAASTGVLLDQTYTGKAVQGMLAEMAAGGREEEEEEEDRGCGRFAGERVLYVHTGGLIGLMDGRAAGHMDRGRVQSYGEGTAGIGSMTGWK